MCECERESEREQTRKCVYVFVKKSTWKWGWKAAITPPPEPEADRDGEPAKVWESQTTRGNGHPGDQVPRAPGAQELPSTQQSPPWYGRGPSHPGPPRGWRMNLYSSKALLFLWRQTACISSLWCTFSFTTPLCLVVSVCRQTKETVTKAIARRLLVQQALWYQFLPTISQQHFSLVIRGC